MRAAAHTRLDRTSVTGSEVYDRERWWGSNKITRHTQHGFGLKPTVCVRAADFRRPLYEPGLVRCKRRDSKYGQTDENILGLPTESSAVVMPTVNLKNIGTLV